ncbi:hypothetical protein ACFYM0_14385 [Streptomyces sp. NPDC006487]|uniref:hypothetical protein n=1 Tax=Streptomyces sp. NPDC006487 TaxID=3364748 RepID=UPI0036A4258A
MRAAPAPAPPLAAARVRDPASRRPPNRRSLRPALAIAGATARSQRNTVRRMLDRSPVITSAVLLVLFVFGLAMVAFQVQALAPLVHEQTLTVLQDRQLKEVNRAALAGMAAAASGATLILDILGLQPAGVRVLAVSKGVGRWNRALGELIPPYVTAMTVSSFLVGPVTVLSLTRVQASGGTSFWLALAVALLFSALTALVATVTTLAVQALTALVMRSSNDALGVKSVSASLCGILLITGIGLVLAGRTSGLYVLCPPLAVTGGVPETLPGVLLAVSASLLWGLLCAYVLSCAGTTARNNESGAPWQLRFVRLPGRGTRTEARQLLRDPLYISATCVSLAAAAAVAVLYHLGYLQDATASLLLLGVCGISSLITGLAPFRLAGNAWIYAIHPRGFSLWGRQNAFGAIAVGLLTVVAVRVVSLVPFEAGRDVVILSMALAGSALSVLFGLATVTADFAEKRVTLLVSGLMSGAALGGLFWLASSVEALSTATATATAAHWLLVCAAALCAVQQVMRVKDRDFARTAER